MRAYTSLPTCAKKGSIAAVMAIYHFSAKVVSRANGSSAVASAADGIQTALTKDDFFSRTDFLDARSVAASAQIMPTTPSTRHLLDGVAACTRLTV